MLSICAVVVSVDFDMAVRIADARQTSFGIVFVSDSAAGGSLDAPDPVFRIVLEMQPVSSRGCHGLKISERTGSIAELMEGIPLALRADERRAHKFHFRAR